MSTKEDSKLVVLFGSPGAGKTTLARQTCEAFNRKFNSVSMHLEVDNIRDMLLGDASDYTDYPLWLDIINSIINTAATCTGLILIEGLFHNPKTLQKLNSLYPKTKFLLIDTPLSICLQRNSSRPLADEILEDKEVEILFEKQKIEISYSRIDGREDVACLVNQIIGIL